MCGINVIVGGSLDEVKKMSSATKHRGISESFRHVEGDDINAWVGYNHLPTTDESISSCGFETKNYFVWLNGYISNYKELAKKYQFILSTDRDTEVLALFIEKFNFDPDKLQELNGFFSIVVYNKKQSSIGATTDRYGIKQLYTYSDKNGKTYISSEVKGILAVCPNIELDNEAAEDWNYSLGVMTEHTIYKGIRRVGKLPMPIIERTVDTSKLTYMTARKKLVYLFSKALERNRYNGDSGVYLSGGIDSGMIARYLNPEYCFSVDYVHPTYSENELMKLNSKGKHLSIVINKENAKEYADRTMLALDDLKAGSCYTNFAVAELASKFVRVVYSGAGGDEFFGGYPHRNNKDINDVINRTSGPNKNNYDISHFDYDLRFLQSVLVVEDRMSGFHTMETRYPFLDNDLVNFALSLPLEFLKNKCILKDISGLDSDVKNGKKKGFSNPYFRNEEWMKFAVEKITKS